MKKKWPVLIVLLVAIVSLFLPALGLHVHAQLGEETAALFPQTLSLWEIITKGTGALPTDSVPALSLVHFGGWMTLAGLVLMALSAVLTLPEKKGFPQLAFAASLLSIGCLGGGVAQLMNLQTSLLYTVLFTVKAWAYIPLVAAFVMALITGLALRHAKALIADDKVLRRLSALVALVALLVMLLPAYVIQVPSTLTDNPKDAEAISRSVNLYQLLPGTEPNLYNEGQAKGVYTGILTGDILALEPYSADGTNISGIFLIRSSNAAMQTGLLAGMIFLALSLVLALIPRVDRWFAVVAGGLSVILIIASCFGLLFVGDADMYAASSRQLLHLGLGTVTPIPFLAGILALFSVVLGTLGIARANEPYFVNPIPQGLRIRFVAAALILLSLACILLPAGTVSYSKPGKSKVQATAEIRGLDALTFSTDAKLADPVDSKGKAVYDEDDAEYSRAAVNAATAGTSRTLELLTWGALLLTLVALVLLVTKKSPKAIILLLLLALALRLVTWLTISRGFPKAVIVDSGSLYLYASLPLLVFSAFFTIFAHLEELPKKYKLFLMMLPFLVAVFLFSYLPLYGWSYAFYNYKFGIPMDQQEFVGFRWFTEMFTNAANRDNIVRVLKNTFGMSGLNLLTSWMPMIFAVFLNEITRTRFKKFVQIFTTLPNFISWALVFSFAMCMFAADTGIFSKFMMSIGLNDPNNPTVWLNSNAHIWLKMWGWSTWKGLGWGAIMYLAAIAGIDQELYEAARVDGANRWALMRHITLPSLLPTFFVLLMLSISNILNNGMEQYLVFQNPMNRQTIEVLDLYVYNITIASKGTSLYSYATAIGILKTLVSVTLLFSANFVSKKLRGESIM